MNDVVGTGPCGGLGDFLGGGRECQLQRWGCKLLEKGSDSELCSSEKDGGRRPMSRPGI